MTEKFDMFGRAVPTLNLGGDDHIRSRLGGIVSMMIMLTTFLFAL